MADQKGLAAVGICGRIGAGKDTVADMLMELAPGKFHRYAIADPIRRIARDVFGFTDLQLGDHALKEQVDPFWDMTPRRFMQLVGTELFRERLDRRVWIKLAGRKMLEHADRHLLIPDIRTRDEVQMVKDSGGVLVKVTRPGYEAPAAAQAHATEGGISDDLVDIQVDNSGTQEDLMSAVLAALPRILDLVEGEGRR